jgi:hypothetical protein
MYKSIDPARVRNLKVVAKLKVGNKLCCRYHRFTIDSTSPLSLTSIMRYINGESRSETCDSLTDLVLSCVNQAGLAEDEKPRLIRQLLETRKGIVNLCKTYKDDETTVSSLEFILENIDIFTGYSARPETETKENLDDPG